jgi:hypothetical protein
MTDQNAHLYNLQEANSLSRKLAAENKAPSVHQNVQDVSSYLTWPSTSPVEPDSPSDKTNVAKPAVSDSLPQVPAFDSIELLIDWGIDILGATGAFIIDPQGFMISIAGDVSQNDCENIGAAICCGIEDLNAIGSTEENICWLELVYKKNSILSFLGQDPKVSNYLVAFVDNKQISRNNLLTLISEFGHRLAELI